MALFKDKIDSKLEKMKQDKVINDLLNKKAMLEKAAETDINTLKGKISQQFSLLGEGIYNEISENGAGTIETGKFQEFVKNVNDMKAEIQAKTDKLAEMLLRYDEEIKMINPQVLNEEAKCPKCSNPYTPGENNFCQKCGEKLV